MSSAHGNLVVQNTSTVGMGSPLTLTTAVAPYLTAGLAGFLDGSTVDYSIIDGTANSESGYGVLSSSATSLTRNVLESTNGNLAVSLTGNAIVRITPMRRTFDPLNAVVAKMFGAV